MSALVEVQQIRTAGGQAIWGNASFGSNGWWIGIEDNLRFQVGAHISTTTTILSSTPADLAFLGVGLVLAVLRLVQDDTTNYMELWLQGRRIAAATYADPTPGPLVPGTGAPQVGLGIFGNVAAESGIVGVQYLEGTLTDAQLREHFAACYAAGDVVSPAGQGWASWSVKRGSPGASWAPSDGTGPTLTRSGSLTTVTRPAARFLG